MKSRKFFSALISLFIIFLMTSAVFAENKSDFAELPEGVEPITSKPSSQNLIIKTDEARKLYDTIRSFHYPSMNELKNSPVVAQLDALSNYYVKKYGITADINTPERQELREKVLKEFLSTGSARKISEGKYIFQSKYVFDGELKKNYQMTLVLGLPSVGKSTVYTNPHSEKTGAFVLDCDDIKKLLPEYKESYGGAADAVHAESFEIMNMAMENFLTGEMKGVNVILPIVAGNFDELMNKYIKPFESAGYDVQAVFIDADENISFALNLARQLDSGRLFNSKVATSFGKKPKNVYNRLKNLKNSKGKKYGLEMLKFKKY